MVLMMWYAMESLGVNKFVAKVVQCLRYTHVPGFRPLLAQATNRCAFETQLRSFCVLTTY